MSDYRVIYEDPDNPDDPVQILVPAPNWIKEAMTQGVVPIAIYWALRDAEQKALDEGWHDDYKHDQDLWRLQYTAKKTPPLTEEQAIEYLILQTIPKSVWSNKHNRPMFKIVRKQEISSDRQFRDAWRMAG